MNTHTPRLVLTSLLGSLLAISAMPPTESQVPPQPPGQSADPQNPEETEEEKEKRKKKKQEQEERQRQQQLEQERKRQTQTPEERQQEELQKQRQEQREEQQPPPPKDRQQQSEVQQTPKERQQQTEQRQTQQSQQSQQVRQREIELQKQQERELQQKRAQQERQLKQRRVTQQEQQERIRRQEQQLALYRKNIALREELAERDAQILRQQNRIQHLRFQQQYEERLRAQRVQLLQARHDYYNDPYYYTAPNYRYVRGGQYYQTNQYGIRKLEQALQAGYNEGYRAGRADREDRWRYDYRSAFAYRDANFGYDGRYIAQDEYNHYFREGFQRGYDDGYYGRNKFGRKKDDGGINDEWLIAGAVVAAIIGYQVLTD
jgi:hypothetical protein